MSSRHVPEYRDYREAQEASINRSAISTRPIRVVLNGAGLKLNKTVLVHVVRQRGKNDYVVYRSAHIPIPHSIYKPTTKDIDAVRTWKAV